MNCYLTFRTIKYRLFSRHRKGHGIHSPFVYDLIRNYFLNKCDRKVVYRLKRIRNVLHNYHSGLFNPGIKVKRMKGEFCRNHYSIRYMLLMYNMAAMADNGCIVVSGSLTSPAALALAIGNEQARVMVFNDYDYPDKEILALLGDEGIKNVSLHNALSPGELDKLLCGKDTFPGIIYLAGINDPGELLLKAELFMTYAGKNSVIIIEDIHRTADMGDAWTVIKASGSVSISIDILHCGMLFFREGTAKQDFVIRH